MTMHYARNRPGETTVVSFILQYYFTFVHPQLILLEACKSNGHSCSQVLSLSLSHRLYSLVVPVQKPKEGSLVALRSVEEDGSTYWYRAKVRANLPQEGKVELKLVDYGNTDVVEAKDVMLLPSTFYQLPFQAIHCCLRGLSNFLESPKIYETFMEYQLQDKALTAKVVTRYLHIVCV